MFLVLFLQLTVVYAGKREYSNINVGETVTLQTTYHSHIQKIAWHYDINVFEPQNTIYGSTDKVTFKVKKKSSRQTITAVTSYYLGNTTSGIKNDEDTWTFDIFGENPDDITVSLQENSPITLTVGDKHTFTAHPSSDSYSGSYHWKLTGNKITDQYHELTPVNSSTAQSVYLYADYAGEADVMVYLDNMNSSSVHVIVKSKNEPTTVPVSGISLDPTSMILTEGSTQDITATVSPYDATNKSVSWCSNDTIVATVSSSGKVTAKKAGSAIITCTSDYNSYIKATCSVTVTASVKDGETVETNSLKYRIYPSYNTAVVARQQNSLSGTIAIPERISYKGENYTVIEIGDSAFWYQSNIKAINISSKVKKIGDYAFLGAESLTSIEIPDNVESIGREPFNLCSSLESVYIGKGLNSIGTYPFYSCPKLKDIIVSTENNYFKNVGGLLYSKDSATVYKVPESMEKVELASEVQRISNGCFALNSLIKEISLPQDLSSIAALAFEGCTALQSIDIPDGVEYIWYGAFKRCKSLRTIKIGQNVVEMGPEVFATGGNYSKVYIRAAVPPTIEESTFDNYATTLYVPMGSKSEYDRADYWKNFHNIIERDFDGVEEIVLSDESLEMIVGDTHKLTYSITPADAKSELIWTSSDSKVATVDNGVITADGPGTATITCTSDDGNRISASCKVIVNALTQEGESVTLEGIAYRLFPSNLTAEVSLLPYYLKGVISIPPKIEYKDKSFTVTKIGHGAGAITNEFTAINIPSTIDSIGNYAFSGAKLLPSIEIPDNVKYIGTGCFYGCELLESIYIGNGLNSLGMVPFNSCPNLKDISVSSDNMSFKTEGGILYSKDSSIIYKVPEFMSNVELSPEVVQIWSGCFSNNSLIKEMVLPQKLDEIYMEAFYGCISLQSVVIPEKLRAIGYGAFEGCISLSKIYTRAAVPPMIEESTFDNYAATLYVPIGSKSEYGRADYWNNFQNIVEHDFDGVEEIVLSEESLEMTVGETHTLTYSITPADAKSKLIWTSSDTSVATVSDGVITAVGTGAATIICTSDDGNKVSASCQVIVSRKPVLVESIKLNYSNVELTEGEGIQLTATVSPSSATDPSVTWESLDESVAKVDNEGYVVAIKQGTSVIICSANDDSGSAATCLVQVNNNIVLVESIELNYSNVELTEGEGIQLTATVSPSSATDPSVTWESLDESVAKVDNEGYVVAIKQGTSVIICSANDDSGAAATCLVKVNSNIVLVESIELNCSNVELSERDSLQLTAKVSPSTATDSSVTWESSDKTVAMVDNEGYVTALKGGMATITCKANDGSGVSASCQVTVREKIILVESIELNYSSVEVTEGEGLQLTATVNPSSATDSSVTWSSSDKSVAMVDNEGYVAALKPGTATITCTANDGSGVMATCVVTVIEDSGVDSIYDSKGIIVYTGNGIMRVYAGRQVLVTIFTVNGVLVKSVRLNADETVEIPLTPGVYIVNGVKYIID